MKVVFISDNGLHHKKITINIWVYILLPILCLVAGLFSYSLYSHFSSSQVLPITNDSKVREDFSLVLSKLSALDAEVQRLNTLSTHIASKSKLDIKAFNLSHVPAQGGAVDKSYYGAAIVRNNDIQKSVSIIERNLAKQKLKLRNLVVSLEIKEAEDYLSSLSNKAVKPISKSQNIRNEGIVYDFSTPLKKGYISSPFGDRKDPINGRLRHHGGLDIAANKGSNIYAIANGFVTFSGNRGAYGNLLEINHSESLKSRYAHLDHYLVKKGQLVKKGDLIGKVGDTGRVTGPHLHLEIRENNKIIDPKVYLKDALKDL